jgi:Alkylmercury lyase
VTPDSEDLRLAVYHGFASTGQPPSVRALAGRLGVGPEQVRQGLRRLHEQRHVVLDAEDRIVMAHPFSSIPLGFAVMGASALWWGGCAWDSFALPHLLPGEHDVLVSTRCPGCGAPHAWVVGRQAPPAGDQVAHFLVPVAQMWDDVVRTCGHQRLFCDATCVNAWLDRIGHERGYVMDLPTLWRLAAHWYDGRLDRGYTRREPAAAAAYFRQAGLQGPFWGL